MGAKEEWNERYSCEGFLYGKEPDKVIVDNVDLIKEGGKILDIGMGEGRNAVYLAMKGYKVEGMDISAVAVEKANKLAAESGVSIDAKAMNLDFFIAPVRVYEAMILSYYHPNTGILKMIGRALNPGGLLFMEGYTTEHLRLFGSETIDFSECFKPNEMLRNMQDMLLLYYDERIEEKGRL